MFELISRWQRLMQRVKWSTLIAHTSGLGQDNWSKRRSKPNREQSVATGVINILTSAIYAPYLTLPHCWHDTFMKSIKTQATALLHMVHWWVWSVIYSIKIDQACISRRAEAILTGKWRILLQSIVEFSLLEILHNFLPWRAIEIFRI